MDLIDVLVWVGTITFAITGALVAVHKGFDLVGVVVLGSVTAIGGGSIRDLMADVIPPSSLSDDPLLWTIVITSVAVLVFHNRIPEGKVLYVLDTLGLAVFAGLGAERAVDLDFGLWGTVFAGVVSGVGGGIIRDVLSGEVPGILYRSGDFYAFAAGGGALVGYLTMKIDPVLGLILAILTTLAIRFGSRMTGINLPVPRDAPTAPGTP